MMLPDVGSYARTMQRPSVVFPQPGLPDQPERPAGADGQVDPVDRLHHTAAPAEEPAMQREVHGQAVRRQQAHCSPSPYSRQATSMSSVRTRTGTVSSHFPAMNASHRGWNRHPDGRSYGGGTVPRTAASRR